MNVYVWQPEEALMRTVWQFLVRTKEYFKNTPFDEIVFGPPDWAD